MSNKIIIAIVLLILAVGVGYWITLPKSYEDCILKYMDDAKTQLAASHIGRACRKQFPEIIAPKKPINSKKPRGAFENL